MLSEEDIIKFANKQERERLSFEKQKWNDKLKLVKKIGYFIGRFLLILILLSIVSIVSFYIHDCKTKSKAEVQVALDTCVSSIDVDTCIKLHQYKDVNYDTRMRDCSPRPDCVLDLKRQEEENRILPYKKCVEYVGAEICDKILE